MSDPLERAKATPAVAFCFLLNRLLSQEGWARERLAAFAGQSFELRPPLLPPLRLSVLGDGTVAQGGADPQAVIGLDGITGGALADELRRLARDLRWDAEEELSKVVGDFAAHRIAAAGRSSAAWAADTAGRLSQTLADYGVHESRMLVRRAELASLSEALTSLEAGIAALEQRMARLA